MLKCTLGFRVEDRVRAPVHFVMIRGDTYGLRLQGNLHNMFDNHVPAQLADAPANRSYTRIELSAGVCVFVCLQERVHALACVLLCACLYS